MKITRPKTKAIRQQPVRSMHPADKAARRENIELEAAFRSGKDFGWVLLLCGFFGGFTWLIFGLVWLIASMTGLPRAIKYAEGMTEAFSKALIWLIGIGLFNGAALFVWLAMKGYLK